MIINTDSATTKLGKITDQEGRQLYRAIVSGSFGAYEVNLTKDRIEGISADNNEEDIHAIFMACGIEALPFSYTDYLNALVERADGEFAEEYVGNAARETLLNCAENGEMYAQAEAWFIKPDGTRFYPVSEFYLYTDEKTGDVHALVVCRDRTSQMLKMEDKIKASKGAKHKGNAARSAKKATPSDASYDVRTPMNAIVGFAELAAANVDDPQVCMDCITKIQTTSQAVLKLINDNESEKVELLEEPSNIVEIIKEVHDVTQAKANEKRQHFYLYTNNLTNRNILCDRLRLHQILLNLIGDAIEFTNVGGTVTVRISQVGKRDGFAEYEIRVKDTSIATPDTHEAITQNIVEMMGGSLQKESEKGKGAETVVKLRFKIDGEEPKSAPKETITGIYFHRERVLLVEDNESSAKTAQELLRKANLRPDIAENGQIAVKMLKKADPGYYKAVLMDVQMPVMDGIEATRQIRKFANPWTSTIPIIAMTSNSFGEEGEAIRRAGMNAHIAKPLSASELLLTLNDYISR